MNYPSKCICCGADLTSEEFGGLQCFVCEYMEQFDDPYDEEEYEDEERNP